MSTTCLHIYGQPTIAKSHKTQDPKQYANSLSGDVLDSANIDRLTIVSEPVAKIYSCYHHLIEPLAACGSRHDKLEEGIFDVALSCSVIVDDR